MFKWLRIGNFELLTKISLLDEKLTRELKDIRQEIEKIDIKAMEAQRSYRAKLKRLTGETEKEETETNKKSSIFLSPDGTFI